MFKRNTPLTPLQHARELFWPSMGWRKALKYVKLRIIRLSDSNHKIALGLALGVGISFNPFLGTHFIQVSILAFLLRANILSALIGTFVGNPWTFPFLWWSGIALGIFVLQLFGHTVDPVHQLDMVSVLHIVEHHPSEILMPWAVGSYIVGAVSVVVTYPVFLYLVDSAKKSRVRAREANVRKALQAAEGRSK